METIYEKLISYCDSFAGIRTTLENACIIHNYALDQIPKIPGFPNMKEEGVEFRVVREFVNKSYPYVDVKSLITEEQFLELFNKLLKLEKIDRVQDFPKVIYDDGFINIKQKTILEFLFNILVTPSREEKEKKVWLYDLLISKIAGFESSLVIKHDLSDEDKSILIAATTIARYSLKYWYLAAQDPDHPWYELLEEETKKIKLPKWLGRGIRDAVGFVGGYAVGFMLGSGPTLGPVVGAACGSCVGAAFSSQTKK